MVIYNYFDGFNWTSNANMFEKLSFGNMGFSGNYCGQRFISWDKEDTKISLQCQGTARIRAVIDTGIVDVNQGGEDERLTEFNRCYYEKPVDIFTYPIMFGFDEAAIEETVMTQCNGLQQCSPSIPNKYFGTKAQGNWNSFIFMQVACEQDEDMVFLKNAMGLVVSVLGLYICLFFRNALVSYQQVNKINDRLYDAKLITLGDYSVMGKVYSSQYNEFVKKLTTEQEKENKTLLFERHLINEIEKWVCKNDMCGNNVEERQKNLKIIEKGEQIPPIYAVADLQLAFDND